MGWLTFNRLLAVVFAAGFVALLAVQFEDWATATLSLPVYFHVVLLLNLGLWCWATNLHVLNLLGVDTYALLEGSAPLSVLPTAAAAPSARPLASSPASLEPDAPGGGGGVPGLSSAVEIGAEFGQPSTSASLGSGNVAGSGVPWASPKSVLDRLTTPARPKTAAGGTLTRHASTIRATYAMAAGFTLVTLLSLWLFEVCADAWGEERAEFIPLALYALALFVAFNPWKIVFHHERFKFMRSLSRSAFGGLWSAVPFCDVVLSDILTSFSRVVGDLQLVFCDLVLSPDASAHPGSGPAATRKHLQGMRAAAPPLMEPLDEDQNDFDASFDPEVMDQPQGLLARETSPVELASVQSQISFFEILAPLLIAYAAHRCSAFGEYNLTKDPKQKRRHLANALKYLSSLPVIYASYLINRLRVMSHSDAPLSSDEHTTRFNAAVGLWIVLSVINSLYSLYWDVAVDWGLGTSFFDSVASQMLARIKAQAARLFRYQRIASVQGDAAPPARRGAVSRFLLAVWRRASTALGLGSAGLRSPPPPTQGSSPVASIYHSGTSGSLTSRRSRTHSDDDSSGASADAVLGRNAAHALLRPTLFFRFTGPYYAAITIDVILRLSWIARVKLLYRLGSVHGHNADSVSRYVIDAQIVGTLAATDLALKTLEIVRRWVWVFFRVEREWVVTTGVASLAVPLGALGTAASSGLDQAA
ncbi:protein-ER retention protein [Polyrhizophydium stewartii]|uniref:Protein-ER retention protein n=1 Tax=Polyrhizophydium stewartii TaxID=2732419 RepID=A0ABR4N5R1_9FUNG